MNDYLAMVLRGKGNNSSGGAEALVVGCFFFFVRDSERVYIVNPKHLKSFRSLPGCREKGIFQLFLDRLYECPLETISHPSSLILLLPP